MDTLFYTNEFLKKLEPILEKNDFKTLEKIKKVLEKISLHNCEGANGLQNIKTYKNSDIFQEKIEDGKINYSIFWTAENGRKIIITLIKNKKAKE